MDERTPGLAGGSLFGHRRAAAASGGANCGSGPVGVDRLETVTMRSSAAGRPPSNSSTNAVARTDFPDD